MTKRPPSVEAAIEYLANHQGVAIEPANTVINYIRQLEQAPTQSDAANIKLTSEEWAYMHKRMAQPEKVNPRLTELFARQSDAEVAREILNTPHLNGGYNTELNRITAIIARHRQASPARVTPSARDCVEQITGYLPCANWNGRDLHKAAEIIQTALDAAKEEGARKALEAAAKWHESQTTGAREDFHEDARHYAYAEAIRVINPQTIAKGE